MARTPSTERNDMAIESNHLYYGLKKGTIVDNDYVRRECGVWIHVDDRDDPCDCESCENID